jgi:RND family efflux transporter MFP subunit
LNVSKMQYKRAISIVLPLVAIASFAVVVLIVSEKQSDASAIPVHEKTSLTVNRISPTFINLPQVIPATGNIVAWQEAVIGAEISNYRILEVLATVGDRIKKGQVLARIESDTVASELAEANAVVTELLANSVEAKGNSDRAAELASNGFYSKQLTKQYQTAETATQARLEAAKARLLAAQVKMSKTKVLAPDDGVISARSATVGSLTQPGQELFRLIRGARLEWRAELSASEMAKIKKGNIAALFGPNAERVTATVSAVAPSIDPQTRNGLVYVDIPGGTALRAGVFANGEFEVGRAQALALPRSAVVLRDGFAYVFKIESDNHLRQIKVSTGRYVGDLIEIVSGLDANDGFAGAGAGFLTDGDFVKVVTSSTTLQ